MYARRGFCASCAACARPGTSCTARRICVRICQLLWEPLKRHQSDFYARGYKYLSHAIKTPQRPRTRPAAALQRLTAAATATQPAGPQRQRHGSISSSGSPTDCQTRSPPRAGSLSADRPRRAVETLRRPRRTRTAASAAGVRMIAADGRSRPPRGLPAVSKPAEPPRAETVRPRQPLTRRTEKPLDFSNGFEKNSDQVFEKFLESLEKLRCGIRSAIVAE